MTNTVNNDSLSIPQVVQCCVEWAMFVIIHTYPEAELSNSIRAYAS